MQSHGPKRIYTPNSLEFWFEKLESDWAGAFTDAQLEKGREIYVGGQVRELELTDRDAIVHRRVEKRDEYAVIEWSEKGLNVRSSSTDPEHAHALAVAGLHEIEELVADEISPLPGDVVRPDSPSTLSRRDPQKASDPAGNSNGTSLPKSPAAASLAKTNGEAKSPAAPAASGPSRTLILVFKTKSAGLTFQAVWLEPDRKTRVAALGPEAHAGGNGHVSSAERAKLIGLAAYARKAHFHYNQETGLYVLESLVEIPNFLRTVLPAWRRMFTLELDDKSANLLKGTRMVEIEAVAERTTPAGASGAGESEHVGLNLRQ